MATSRTFDRSGFEYLVDSAGSVQWHALAGFHDQFVDLLDDEDNYFIVEHFDVNDVGSGMADAQSWDRTHPSFGSHDLPVASIMGSGVELPLVDDKEWFGSLPDLISTYEWSRAVRDMMDRLLIGPTVDSNQYEAVLTQTPQGYAVSCPALFGCHSQGTSKDEALENIKEAITVWLQVDASQTAQRKNEMIADGVRYGYPVECVSVAINKAKV